MSPSGKEVPILPDVPQKRSGCGGCMKKMLIGSILFGIVVVVGAGVMVYKDIQKQRELAWQEILLTHQQLQERLRSYSGMKEEGRFEFYAPYAERENWDAQLERAKARLSKITSDYIGNEEIPLKLKIPETTKEIGHVKADLKKVDERMAYLDNVRKTAPAQVRKAESAIAGAGHTADAIEGYIETVKSDFPEKRERIEEFLDTYSDFEQRAAGMKAPLAFAQAELEKKDADAFVDYVKLDESLQEIEREKADIERESEAVRQTLEQLYHSRSRILADMRADYYLTLGRSTWDNSSDYDTEKIYTYPPVKVSPELYEYFTSLDPNKSLANLYETKGEFKARPAAHVKRWNELDINPGASVARVDDAGVFWLEDAPVKTYHRYRIVEDGQSRQTDWKPVGLDEYQKMYPYLGMEIYAKPYGVFPAGAVQVPEPPGMAFVGNPRYGQWRSAPDGDDSYWDWNDEYDDEFEIDIDVGKKHRFHRKDWVAWKENYRGKKPYYGETDAGVQTFGTEGAQVRKSSRFRNTAFVAAGGLAAAAASFRGAGPGRRGGGPGGFGK